MRTRTVLGSAFAGTLTAAVACAGASAQAPSAVALGVGARGSEPARSSDVDQLLWTAEALGPLLAANDYPSVLFLSALARVADERGGSAFGGLEAALEALAPGPVRADPTARAVPTTGLSPALSGGLDLCRREPNATAATLCSMERLVPLLPPDMAHEVTEGGARLLALHAGPSRSAADPMQALAEEALEGLWRLRVEGTIGGDSGALALDGLLANVLGSVPGDAVGGGTGRAPELRRLLEAYPLARSSLPRSGPSVGSVLEGYRSFLDGVSGSLGGLLLPAPEALRGGLPSRLAPVASALGAGDDAQVAWGASRSFVYLASRSAELAGAPAGVTERMRALGTAAADLQREATSFPARLAAVGRDLAVATLTGNVLDVASRITSFFHGAPGALGFGAGREVQALREGIEAMRGELRAGFADVDRRVDEVLGALDERFERLEVLVESNGRLVQAELAALHEGVLALGERLDRMDGALRSYMQAGFDRDYARTLVRCLEHRERYLPPFDEMGFALFSECLGDFRARAVGDARDALLTDQSTPVDDVSLAAALADPSIENLSLRLPLLGRVAERRYGYTGIRGGRGLANAVEWTVAAEAYLEMLRDWPAHARAVSAGDLEAIRSAGLDLQRALRAIVRDETSGAGAELLSRVLADYALRLRELSDEVDVLARRHRQEAMLRVRPEDVLRSLEAEERRLPDLDVPDAIGDAVPQELRTAVVLGLETATLSYRLAFEDSVSRGSVRHRFLFFGKRHDRLTFTRASVEVALRVGSLGPVAHYRARGPWLLWLTEEMDGDHRSDRVRKATPHVPDLARHFLAETWPELSTQSPSWTLEDVEPRLVQRLEDRIESELRRHATVGLENVFASVCAEDPPAFALPPADRESARRIRSALNGLSAARALLESYLRLGAPDALAAPGALRDALLGPEAVLDRRALCAGVAGGESALRLVWLEGEPERRLAKLAEALDPTLESVLARGGPSTRVDATLERLDAAIRVQRLRAAVASSGGARGAP